MRTIEEIFRGTEQAEYWECDLRPEELHNPTPVDALEYFLEGFGEEGPPFPVILYPWFPTADDDELFEQRGPGIKLDRDELIAVMRQDDPEWTL